MQVKPTCAPRGPGVMEGTRRANPPPIVVDSAQLPTRRGDTRRSYQSTFIGYSSILLKSLRGHTVRRRPGLFPTFPTDSVEGAQ